MPHAKGHLLGERTCLGMPITLFHELCKNGQIDQFTVWVVDSCGPKEAQVKSYSQGCANVIMGRHIDSTWQIRLNHPSAAAMRPCVKLL